MRPAARLSGPGTAPIGSAAPWRREAVLRSYLVILLRVMSWRVAVAVAAIVVLSLVEGVILVLLLPLLELLSVEVGPGAAGRLTEVVASIFSALGTRPSIITVLAFYIVAVGLHALFSYWQAVAFAKLVNGFQTHLGERLYGSILEANWLFFTRRRTSEFNHALSSELGRAADATQLLLRMTASAIVAIIYIVFAIQLSAAMTVLVLVGGLALLVLLRGSVRAARLSGEQVSRIMDELYAAVGELLAGMKVTKSYGAEAQHEEIFSRVVRRLQQANVETQRGFARSRSWSSFGSVFVLCSALFLSFEVFRLPAGSVLLLIFVFFRVMPRLAGIHQSWQAFVNLLPGFATVLRLESDCRAAAEQISTEGQVGKLSREVRLADVSFRYGREAGAEVVHAVDLVIRAGQTTAVVGPSGAGKSTLTDLVVGLISPTRGRVLVDGSPLSPERMRSWRSQIGYVTQDTFLFHDSVRANLLWACPDADDSAIWRALRLAAADEFVAELPGGLETVLGDRGIRLSGGERQRLALARALLRAPALLILDEATSSLDSENERRIQRAIDDLHGTMTILVITHRLSTIRGADVIHVLEQGRLVESGDWHTLLDNEQGRFRALCRAQGLDRAGPKGLADESLMSGQEPSTVQAPY